MERFNILKGIAAPLPIVNVDTDMIIPKQFLKTIKRTGLGKNLFNDLRYDEKGQEIKSFVLNQPAYRRACILVTHDNFGCGSSREHAPWALLDFGIRCVIAPSFADIFYNNCFKNGILPLVMAPEQIDVLMKDAEDKKTLTVDLEGQRITTESGHEFLFSIDDFRKSCLLSGLDDIGLTLEHEDMITDFEIEQREQQPWLYPHHEKQ